MKGASYEETPLGGPGLDLLFLFLDRLVALPHNLEELPLDSSGQAGLVKRREDNLLVLATEEWRLEAVAVSSPSFSSLASSLSASSESSSWPSEHRLVVGRPLLRSVEVEGSLGSGETNGQKGDDVFHLWKGSVIGRKGKRREK